MNSELEKRLREVVALLDRVTPLYLFIGLSSVSMLIMLMTTCSVLSTDGPLPPPRDPPPAAEHSAVLSYRYKEGYYKSIVEEDAKLAGVAVPTMGQLLAKHPYAVEFSGNQLMVPPKGVLETRHLRLEALNMRVWVGEQGEGYRTDHAVLSISNRTNVPLAYRVVTEASGRCENKGILRHNALALEPFEKVLRTECLAAGARVRVVSVESLELAPLGYQYVSRIDPLNIGASNRTAEGHVPAKLKPCRTLPWREIQHALEQGETRWVDVIDFYARHNCDEYSFYLGYRWDENGLTELPAIPPTARQAHAAQ